MVSLILTEASFCITRRSTELVLPHLVTLKEHLLLLCLVLRNHSEDFVVTPFAQILQTLRRVRNNYMIIANLPSTCR